MVRKKITWSQTAISELENILAFYIQRNQSDEYSLRLYKTLEKRVQLISVFPTMGKKSDMPDVHILPFQHFGIIYRTKGQVIYILSVWDFRQHPNKRMDYK
ncbi:MAG: type II toxin-antitoxin system RelE/ParE family toxin [Saprospiraceae bacterium]